MPKMKTHKGTAKRFRVTGSGKIMRAKAYKSHILTKKSQKRKTVLKRAKGYYGAKSRSYRAAKEQVQHSLQYAYRDRRNKKRMIRRLWITRINAGARINGLSYSKFMHGLKVAGIDLDRKVLSNMAIEDAQGFAALCEIAKKAIA